MQAYITLSCSHVLQKLNVFYKMLFKFKYSSRPCDQGKTDGILVASLLYPQHNNTKSHMKNPSAVSNTMIEAGCSGSGDLGGCRINAWANRAAAVRLDDLLHAAALPLCGFKLLLPV